MLLARSKFKTVSDKTLVLLKVNRKALKKLQWSQRYISAPDKISSSSKSFCRLAMITFQTWQDSLVFKDKASIRHLALCFHHFDCSNENVGQCFSLKIFKSFITCSSLKYQSLSMTEISRSLLPSVPICHYSHWLYMYVQTFLVTGLWPQNTHML